MKKRNPQIKPRNIKFRNPQAKITDKVWAKETYY